MAAPWKELEAWLPFLGVLVVLLVVFWSAWKFLVRRLDKKVGPKSHWGGHLAQVFSWPVRMVSLIVAMRVATEFAPNIPDEIPIIDNAVRILLVLAIGWMFGRGMIVLISTGSVFRTVSASAKNFFINFIRVAVFIILLLIVLDTIGISVTPLLASLGIGSLAVALALQDTLSNLFSGIYLLVDKPVRIGDYVKIENIAEGTVTRIGLRSTRIRSFSDNIFIIPNSKVAGSLITNFDMDDSEMLASFIVRAPNEADLEKVERLTRETVERTLLATTGAVKNFTPIVRFTEFTNFGINFTVTLKVKSWVDQASVIHELIKALHGRFQKEGIAIH